MWRLMHVKRRLLIYPLVALMFALGMYFVLAFPETLFQFLGRDVTLTGRTRLWTILLPVMANHPLLGYGYAAFWDGWKPEVLGVWIQAERLVPVADNGYIDLVLSLGAVGLGLFLYVFVQAFRRAIEYLRSEPGFIGVWPVIYLCIFAADNICESALLTRGTFPFLVFAIISTSVAMNRKRVMTLARTAENRPLSWETVPL
jgi:O-antigen ligase